MISPGPAILLAVYNGVMNGSRCVRVSALGNITGLMCLSIISALGLSAILLASSFLFTLVKVVGACYLVFLGIKQLRSSRALNHNLADDEGHTTRSLSSYFYEAFIVAITNPKPILFFVALFPQFVDTNEPLLQQYCVMTVVFMVLSFISLCSYGFLAKNLKKLLANQACLKWFHRLSGGLFIGMGIGLVQVKNASA